MKLSSLAVTAVALFALSSGCTGKYSRRLSEANHYTAPGSHEGLRPDQLAAQARQRAVTWQKLPPNSFEGESDGEGSAAESGFPGIEQPSMPAPGSRSEFDHSSVPPIPNAVDVYPPLKPAPE